MRQSSKRSYRGFSLLEVLVVVAVICIVSGMAIVNFSNVLPNFRANSAMDQVLSQLRSARERAIAHRREVQVQFGAVNQITITELWTAGNPPPPTNVTFEGGAQFILLAGPDLPAPYNFGNGAAVVFGGIPGGPPIMKFSTTGSFIDNANNFVNGTVFMGIPGNPLTARAVSILGATGRVRQYHWNGNQWQE